MAAPGLETPLSLEVCEQAMQWWLEMQDTPVDAPTLSAFEHWRSTSHAHEVAWQRAQALAAKMGEFRHAGDVTLAKRALLAPAGNAINRRRAITGMALLLVAGCGAWSTRNTALVQQLRADYSTGIGEQQRVTLSSQLEVVLNTRSALNARRIDHRWHIDLLDGEVLIDTSAPVPLLLRIEQLNASTTRARFSARLMTNGTTQLAVLNGTLQIASPYTTATVELKEGEQARFGPRAMLERQTLQPSIAAWSQGMIVAHGQALQAFLNELARYRRGHLGCDPSLAKLPVWGTYPLADSEQIIEAVATTLNLDVQRFTRLWVNLRAPANNV
ncbi:DUF4880 domain-containing protein [Pseudomonas shirazensis]|uniref:DUF4880 domain-containing protein n=1 Tax=Pseudomonas shirazensis TaxID=2745494 RepID=UPI003D2C0F21